MEFRVGDQVVHCTYGLGQVLAIKEQQINNNVALCYEVQIEGLSIWVPADANTESRLRSPTSAAGLRALFPLLSGPAQDLPSDRRQRNLQLRETLKDGKADSLCRVIRDLAAYKQAHPAWNEYDNEMLKRVEKMLLREWSYTFSIPLEDAAAELHKLLLHKKGK